MEVVENVCYAYLKEEEGVDLDVQKVVAVRKSYEVGMRLEKIFYEEACSEGEEKEWLQLESLLKILREGDAFMIWKLKNCARGPTLNRKLDEFLHEKKIRVLLLSEKKDFLPSSQAKAPKIFARNHEDQLQINAKVKASLQEKKKKGEHIGRVPYGYRLSDDKNGKLSELEEEQSVIKRISMMMEGEGGFQKNSYNGIARIFNEEGIIAPKGAKQWYPSTIRNIYLRK